MSGHDGVDLAGQLCSRLCHDLLNPIGALANGLELLAQEDDPDLRQRCLALLEQSVRASSDRLRFYRLAFGGSSAEPISLGEVKEGVTALVGESEQIAVQWTAATDAFPAPAAKALLTLALLGKEALVRGGTIDIAAEANGSGSEIVVRAAGPRVVLDEKIRQALDGALADGELSSKTAPAVLIQRLAGQLGGAVQYAVDDEALVLGAMLPLG